MGALVRVADGARYITSIDETPLFLNAYSPYFYWLLTPIVDFWGVDSLASVTLLARTCMFLVFATTIYAVFRLRRDSLFQVGSAFYFF